MAMFDRLRALPADTVVIHGACRGADRTAAQMAAQLGLAVESYPADWARFGRAAGPIRNQAMLDTTVDLVLAFHADLVNSKGTADMVRRARAAGIAIEIIEGKMSVSIFIGPGSEDDLNVSNENFCRIMALLCIDIDLDNLAGSFDGPALVDLRRKVTLALDMLRAVPSLDGAAGYERHESTGGAVVIECGISDGYFTDRLPRLLAVIDKALAAGEPVRYS